MRTRLFCYYRSSALKLQDTAVSYSACSTDVPLLVVTFCLAHSSLLHAFCHPCHFLKNKKKIRINCCCTCYTQTISFHVENRSSLLNPSGFSPIGPNSTVGDTFCIQKIFLRLTLLWCTQLRFPNQHILYACFISDHTCRLQRDRVEHNSFWICV